MLGGATVRTAEVPRTILVVDESEVRTVVRRQLESMGIGSSWPKDQLKLCC